jgi:hypothetical protein
MELDPRYLIAKTTDFVDHDISNGRWHAVCLELADDKKRTRRSQLLALQQHLGEDGCIAEAHLDAPADLRVATAVVTAVGLERLEKLAQPPHELDKILRRFEYAQILKPPRMRPAPGLTLPDDIALDSLAGGAPPTKGAKSGVNRDVFAVIDYGCPFMHPLLCTQFGTVRSTRVRALWDQQPSSTDDPRTKPKGFEYGAELSRVQLDAIIRAAAGDERRAYESLGYGALRLRESHGAHSLGMLLDDGLRPRGRTRCSERPDVLFVQLPQDLLGAPNRAVLSRHVVDALVWIESQREPEERVILSLSEGSSQGPNDGSSIVERALQTFTQWGPHDTGDIASTGSRRNRIYIAAGNGFAERLHAEAILRPSEPTSFLWRVPPASELPASVEIWLPTKANGSTAKVQVEVFAPDGRLAARVMHDQVAHWPDARAAAASVATTSWRGNGCTLSVIRLAPTATSSGRVRAPVGDWTIKLTAKTGLKEPAHLFIGRIKQALGFPPRTAQSTFVFGGQRGFVDASGKGTLQGLATAKGVIRVGGVVGIRDKPPPAKYSSRGPSRNRSIVGPDVSVRVDDGEVLKGRRSIGNLSGVSFRMDGTSVGAPLAARLHRATPHPPPNRPDGPRVPSIGKRDSAQSKHPSDAETTGEILREPREV